MCLLIYRAVIVFVLIKQTVSFTIINKTQIWSAVIFNKKFFGVLIKWSTSWLNLVWQIDEKKLNFQLINIILVFQKSNDWKSFCQCLSTSVLLTNWTQQNKAKQMNKEEILVFLLLCLNVLAKVEMTMNIVKRRWTVVKLRKKLLNYASSSSLTL